MTKPKKTETETVRPSIKEYERLWRAQEDCKEFSACDSIESSQVKHDFSWITVNDDYLEYAHYYDHSTNLKDVHMQKKI